MILEYYVYHDYEAAAKSADGQMYPFNEAKEEHEYSCFPGTLGMRLINPGISASVNPADDRKGVIVSLISDFSVEEVERALAAVLISQNSSIAGLCLVATRKV